MSIDPFTRSVLNDLRQTGSRSMRAEEVVSVAKLVKRGLITVTIGDEGIHIEPVPKFLIAETKKDFRRDQRQRQVASGRSNAGGGG